MQLPTFTPQYFSFVEKIDSDQELFDTLQKNTDDLVFFLEIAADDEIWSSKHETFLSLALNLVTEKAYQDQIDYKDILRLIGPLQRHYIELKSIIPHDITVTVNGGKFPENSLLFIGSSDYLRRLHIRECLDKSSKEIILNQFTHVEYSPIHSFINSGLTFEVLTMGQDDLINLLKRTLPWQITGLLKIIQTRLSKYLTDENVIEILTTSINQSWDYLSQHSIDFLNNRYLGFHLKISKFKRLVFEFYNFQEDALKYFNLLLPYITDIICKNELPENFEFGQVLKKATKLIALDLSETHSFSQYFENISTNIKELNLSHCPWLSNDTFKTISRICKEIEYLNLSSNTHLKYGSWGELLKFKSLKQLNLSYCHQIQNSDFVLIVNSCKQISDLNLQGCSQISEDGFHELSKKLSNITHLNLSSCNLNDLKLIEISAGMKKLAVLDISSCDQITEKGLYFLLKNSHSLQELNIFRCNLNFSALNELKRLRPTLQIFN